MVVVEHRQGRGILAEATVKVRVGERVIHTAAEGNGPVSALDAALRKALLDVYPALAHVRLDDYKVRILDSEQRHRRERARADRYQERHTPLEHGGRQHQYHRGQLARAGRQPGIRPAERRRPEIQIEQVSEWKLESSFFPEMASVRKW